MESSPSPVRARIQQNALPPRRKKEARVPGPVDESMSMLMDVTLPVLPLQPRSKPIHRLDHQTQPIVPDDSIVFNQMDETELAELAFKEQEERERKRKERRDFLKNRELEKAEQPGSGKENQGIDQFPTESLGKIESKGKGKGIDVREKAREEGEEKGELLSSSSPHKSPSKNKPRRRREELGGINVDSYKSVEKLWGSQPAQSLETSDPKPSSLVKEVAKATDPEVGPLNSFPSSKATSVRFEESVAEEGEGGKREELAKPNQHKSKVPSRLPRKSSFSNENQNGDLNDLKTSTKSTSASDIKSKIPSPTKPSSFKSRTISGSNKFNPTNERTSVEAKSTNALAEKPKTSKIAPAAESERKQEIKACTPEFISKPSSESVERDEVQPEPEKEPIIESQIKSIPAPQIKSKKEAKAPPEIPQAPTPSNPLPTSLSSTSTANRGVSVSGILSTAEVPVGFRKTSAGTLIPDTQALVKPFSFSASLPTSSKPLKKEPERRKAGGYKANQVPEWIKLRKQKLEIEREFKLKNQVELIHKGVKDPSKEQVKKELSASLKSRPLTKTKVQAFKLSSEQRSLERKEFERIRDENQRILDEAREEQRRETQRREEEEMKKERERTIIRANEIPASSRRVAARVHLQ